MHKALTNNFISSYINQFVICSYTSFSNKDGKYAFGCFILNNRALVNAGSSKGDSRASK